MGYQVTNKGHGRIETRTIRVSTALNDYLDFPHVKQVAHLNRQVTNLDGSKARSEDVYLITSLSTKKASPQRLLELNRNHWHIENKLHWVRDVTFDEDRSRIRKGHGAHMMASLKNLAISILRTVGFQNIAKGLRSCARNITQVFRLIGLILP